MPRGRKKKLDRPIDWKLRIPTSVANAVSEELADPITGKPLLGARSILTERLYRRWLSERSLERENVETVLVTEDGTVVGEK